MRFSIVGLNHKQTPVEIREKLAFAESELPQALPQFGSGPERVLVSTCNRVEVYFASDTDYDAQTLAVDFFKRARGVEPPHLYRHDGADAVRHLFRVACGLDSMVVGETQVLGQVKRAYSIAQESGHTSKGLNKLFQYAFYVAKAIRTETSLAACHVSVSSVAASLAEKIFQDLSSRTALVVGAGETGQFTLEAFQQRGVQRFWVANRTVSRAEEAAKDLRATVLPLDRLAEAVPDADIVISCISTGEYLLTPAILKRCIEKRRQPILLIDLSVPRSIDPAIGQLEDMFLYNVDDLETIATDNLARREREVQKSEEIIERETDKFMSRFVQVGQVARELREHFERVVAQELAALPDDQKRQLIDRLVGKLLHRPLGALQNGDDSQITADLLRRIFGLK
jgi:glutamyl-tRNA reductase